jgi:hypothetical protein
MNLATSKPFYPITSDKESSTTHPVVGESLPSSFHYILTSPADTNPTMSSSISTDMASYAPSPFTYPISSNSVLSTPSTSRASTSPSSSSLSGSSTTFHFGMGSSPLLGSGVSSIPRTFSLWRTPIFHNVPYSSHSGAGLSSMGQASRISPRSGVLPPTGNPSFSHNPNVGFPYGWNWTSSASVGSQAVSSSYSSFEHNLDSFNPSRSPHIGGISGPFSAHTYGGRF